ncbi:MAG: type IV toxin-antitoxin system AbiEi family antitoxin [Endomicrobium sp.]|jgi:hypothetical protein|nr:type IV toxin-antitoxin system AbiEi family antitoxin [Endomicrobium sp.]
MSLEKSLLLKKVLKYPCNIITSSWLKKSGISNQLQYKYKQNGWLQSVGQGAFKKFCTDKISLEDAIYALQKSDLKIPVGGYSALLLKGKNHYIRLKNKWSIFSNRAIKLPKWFEKYHFPDEWVHYKTSFLQANIGLETFKINNLDIEISSLERALFELLYLVPKDISLQEAYEIYELLTTLRPKLLQELLDSCSSIKVKRLFLYLAEKFNYSWFKYLNLKEVNLGSGVRELNKKGHFDKKYNLVIEDRENE